MRCSNFVFAQILTSLSWMYVVQVETERILLICQHYHRSLLQLRVNLLQSMATTECLRLVALQTSLNISDINSRMILMRSSEVLIVQIFVSCTLHCFTLR